MMMMNLMFVCLLAGNHDDAAEAERRHDDDAAEAERWDHDDAAEAEHYKVAHGVNVDQIWRGYCQICCSPAGGRIKLKMLEYSVPAVHLLTDEACAFHLDRCLLWGDPDPWIIVTVFWQLLYITSRACHFKKKEEYIRIHRRIWRKSQLL